MRHIGGGQERQKKPTQISQLEPWSGITAGDCTEAEKRSGRAKEYWVTKGAWLELNTFGNLSGECILTPPFETLQNQSHTHTQKVTFW